MKKGVAITGMGVISSIGNSVKENLNSLLNYKKKNWTNFNYRIKTQG